jgi:hypothetical protein
MNDIGLEACLRLADIRTSHKKGRHTVWCPLPNSIVGLESTHLSYSIVFNFRDWSDNERGSSVVGWPIFVREHYVILIGSG